ncbi:Slp family lipoprotein [Vibrio sp. ZSDE26]|uniref:Slp family lipoprotein n=1 Tax=Vibrio amylolyticus TaxID=2847292 RepID=A0A9X1XI30_9VIBR|nr:Slp family lipoprotein [Vibrio amylolyticus]MCK6262033.1 Slp family lipoprotein [Vibrio amylolyticus]
MNLSLFKTAFVSFALLFISACSSLPEVLSSDDEQLISDYATWINIEPKTTPQVRLGGVIANVTNLEDKTRIEIVNLPISSSAKPDINQQPNGRFVGYVDGFLEPMAYGKGQLISVIGQSSGTEDFKVGESEQVAPVMTITGHHLWKIQERVVINEVRLYPYPCRSLHCRQAYFGPTDGRVIQEVK